MSPGDKNIIDDFRSGRDTLTEEILMMPSDEWGIGDSRFTPLQHGRDGLWTWLGSRVKGHPLEGKSRAKKTPPCEFNSFFA